ncbi:MAG: hypothetical protein EP340_10270 [Alphaproteobacteria bacterium]|nr:MAG: hypothetical protein EP340_10270 [Alphaproteobacteria bacterium]
MSVEHVTQIETDEIAAEEAAPLSASNDDTPAMDQPTKKKRLGPFHWLKTLVGGVFTGLTVTILLGIASGLAIGVLGAIYQIDVETLIIYGVAAGYVSGVIAMVAAIASGVRRTRRKKAELA